MIKIKTKIKNGIVNFNYKTKKSNTFEHLLIIAKMYVYIKQNTDMTNEEIIVEIKKILEEIKEEN